jgi:glutamine amidotransferase
MMLRALVIHYGVGNVFSVSHALRRLGFEVVVSEKPLEGFDCLVMPGVGSFSAAAENVAGYRRELVDLVRSGLPVLGICLGMQLLFESSDEGPGSGLGVFSGRVVGFPRGVKSPHMGWNRLVKVRDTPLLEGVDEGWVYFNHSYYPSPGGQVCSDRQNPVRCRVSVSDRWVQRLRDPVPPGKILQNRPGYSGELQKACQGLNGLWKHV